MSNVLNINENNFFETVNKHKDILVEFYAPWCGPCRAIAPMLDELSSKIETNTKIAKINIDESPNISQAFNIRSVPTFYFLKDGKAKQKFSGSFTGRSLLNFIKENE